MKTTQSELTFNGETVRKVYDSNFKFYHMSSIGYEVEIINHFSKYSKHVIKLLDVNIVNDTYIMERLIFALGDDRILFENEGRRLFFSLTIEEVLDQLDQIILDLKSAEIEHRDINPGNILFDEQNKLLKLTDFYWARRMSEERKPPGTLNNIYSLNDKKAMSSIKSEIVKLYTKLSEELEGIKRVWSDTVGNGAFVNKQVTDKYFDGSSLNKGWSYHPMAIPFFKDIPAHKVETARREFGLVNKNLGIKPKNILDIGCGAGYFLFNLMRKFRLNKAVGYEGDPNVHNFLHAIKNSLKLKELDVRNKFQGTNESFDLIINLNVHMWLYKQMGRERTLEVMKQLINNCKVMFFQTAGWDSSSLFRIGEYENDKDVENMLKSVGGRNVKKIGTYVEGHGAPRHFFRLEGKLET